MREERRPEPQQLADSSSTTQYLYRQLPVLTLYQGILHRRWYAPDGRTWLQIIAPQTLRQAILLAAHCPVPKAHFRRNKMMIYIRSRFYWPEYLQDVDCLLKACTECQGRGTKGTNRAPLQRYDVGVPFQRLCVDVMGPYRVTSNGNRYLITVLDQFTKWPEALPVPNVRSETIASTLLYQGFSRFGMPLEIHSDRAPNFSSELYAEVMRLLGIRRTRTTPLHPSANPVERYNRTLKEHLTLMINETERLGPTSTIVPYGLPRSTAPNHRNLPVHDDVRPSY